MHKVITKDNPEQWLWTYLAVVGTGLAAATILLTKILF